MPAAGCVAADLNNDKRIDLACTGRSNLKRVQNLPPDNSCEPFAAAREPLSAAGISYEVLAADIDESPHPNETPAAYVERLAIDKARAVLALVPARACSAPTRRSPSMARSSASPSTPLTRRRMLRKLSGRPHDVHTGVAS